MHLNPFFRYPAWSLLVALVAAAPLWLGLRTAEWSLDPVALLEQDAVKHSVYREAEAYLPEEEMLAVDLRFEDVFAEASLERIRAVGEAFLALPDVTGVKSLTHSYFPAREGLSFSFRPLVPDGPLTESRREALRELALSHPAVRDLMVSSDGRHALVTVDFDRTFPDRASRRAFRVEVEAILAPFRDETVEVQTAAVPLVREELESSARRFLGVLGVAGMVFLPLVLWVALGAWRLVGFVVAGTLAYLALLPGIFGLTGRETGVFALVLFPLLAGLHLTLLAHVACALQAAYQDGDRGLEALRAMLRRVTRSCLFACLTTGAGLLALAASPVEALRGFGGLGAMGVAISLLFTFGPGVALLRLLFASEEREETRGIRALHRAGERNGRAALALSGRLRRHPWPVAIVAAVLSVILLPGLARLQPDFRITGFLDPGSPTRQMMETLDRAYGGVNLLRMEVDSGRAGGIDSLDFLRYLWEVQRFAEEHDAFTAAYSYALLPAMLNQVWEGGDTEALALPDSRALLQLFTTVMRTQEEALPLLAALNDEERRRAHILVRSRDMPAASYLEAVEEVIARADAEKPEGVTLTAEEGLHTVLEAERRILLGQRLSAGLSLLAVGLLLLALWRSLRLAIAGLLVTAVPVAMALGLAGYLGIALNTVTIMAAAVVFGVAVDDAVHFITYWRQAVERGAENPLAETFRIKAPPVLCTTILLTAMFLFFAFAPFPPVAHFGLIAAAALLITVATVLSVLGSWFLVRATTGG